MLSELNYFLPLFAKLFDGMDIVFAVGMPKLAPGEPVAAVRGGVTGRPVLMPP